MAETKKKTWSEVFRDNYEGISPEAKSLENFIKETYKGDAYIPWATMERLTYMLDDNAEFKNILNKDGGLVHTDVMENHQVNIQKGEVVSETTSQMFAHFVKVQLTFMDKVFVEEYPIQDQDYSAAKIFNQNLVNRALQRAKAKLVARATGLGLKLYEGLDLQFDAPEEDKKPVLDKVETPKKETKAASKKVDTPKVETKVETKEEVKPEVNVEDALPKAMVSVEVPKEIKEIIELMRNSDQTKLDSALQKINVALMKKYGKAIKSDMKDDELVTIISECFSNPEQLLKSLTNLVA